MHCNFVHNVIVHSFIVHSIIVHDIIVHSIIVHNVIVHNIIVHKAIVHSFLDLVHTGNAVAHRRWRGQPSKYWPSIKLLDWWSPGTGYLPHNDRCRSIEIIFAKQNLMQVLWIILT